MRFYSLCLVTGLLVSAAGAAERAGDGPGYLREHVYDESAHAGEALVRVSLASSRWPDCTTLESAVTDIFRIEGVAAKSDQDKALALWKWCRILLSATGLGYAREGPRGSDRICCDPHKILTVYGHHQCDGLSWTMVPLWRAAGYMALDECTFGHTTAALRYRDADGELRYHSFDLKRNYYHWDEQKQRVATRSLPVMRGMVFRHVTTPRELHSLWTSLRPDEIVRRQWQNEGHIVPNGGDRNESAAEHEAYYAYRPGRSSGVYAAAGEEVQTLVPAGRPETFAQGLAEGSRNVACSRPAEGLATFHPQKPGEPAEFVYRFAPPYVVADARCEVTLLKAARPDLCRLLVSRDGAAWTPLATQDQPGQQRVAADLGREAWTKDLPNVYTAYAFFLKLQLQTAGDVRKTGFRDLAVVVHRMLNKRALPNLRPGKNVWKVTADRIAQGLALELAVEYRIDGRPRSEIRIARRFPYYFSIDVPDVPEEVRADYDERFNEGRLQMTAITMRLRWLGGEGKGDGEADQTPPLPAAAALAAFAQSSPHPADLTRKLTERPERDVRQTDGFFPQSDETRDDEAALRALIRELRGPYVPRQWLAAEDLGAYPKALDELLAVLPGADSDLTLFLCKALAEIKDRRAVGPLLQKWKRVPGGAPGTRYIPDALAAIGDPSAVPYLTAALGKCRFDLRFHIAHALGGLGGPEAERALQDLARNDPFPAVREEAGRALAHLRAPPPGPPRPDTPHQGPARK
jgi:hypothetical protein